MLVVNQNCYGKGWKIKGSTNRRIKQFNGLISVRVFPGEKEIELYYMPNSFILGVIVSGMSILGIVFFGAAIFIKGFRQR